MSLKSTKIRVAISAALTAFAFMCTVNTASAANWSGAYLGINGGYGWGTAKYDFAPDSGGNGSSALAPQNTGGAFSQNINGGVFGAQLGMNAQKNHFVYGLEASIESSALKKTSTDVFSTAIVLPTVTYETKVKWYAAITPRLGYAMNDWLFFVKGGLAMGEIESTLNSTSAALSFNRKTDQIGYTVGLGANYDLSRFKMNNWVAGVEYNYIDLGKKTYGGQATPDTTWPVQYTVHPAFSSIKATISYKF